MVWLDGVVPSSQASPTRPIRAVGAACAMALSRCIHTQEVMSMSGTRQVDISYITDRQNREITYHREHARLHAAMQHTPPPSDLITTTCRRWWNQAWCSMDLILAQNLAGKRVLVPGCGFGRDVILLAQLGAQVHGFDISAESLDVARERARRFAGDARIVFERMACEDVGYPDGFFDAVVCVDILHHVDIPQTLAELQRVVKPGGYVQFVEMYTHSCLERIRRSWVVDRLVYPLVRRGIYGNELYITEDEKKLNQRDLRRLRLAFPGLRYTFFHLITSRFVSDRRRWVAKVDRWLLRSAGRRLGSVLGGRLIAWAGRA
jgi:2-polyprenyl-3-methyl-5-hydroxy-6-metoxy-1,4-benzoquinol methylase